MHTLAPQAASEADHGPLSGTLEPLIKVASRHQGGKEEHARSVASELLSQFLSVEENFATAQVRCLVGWLVDECSPH